MGAHLETDSPLRRTALRYLTQAYRFMAQAHEQACLNRQWIGYIENHRYVYSFCRASPDALWNSAEDTKHF